MRLLRVAALAVSVLIFVGVLERLSAAVWKQAKFGFGSDSPIYLNASTVLLFCIATLLLCLVKVIWRRRAEVVKGDTLKWAITVDLVSLAIVGGMLSVGLAKLTQ
mgnify:CR=1 FL=1